MGARAATHAAGTDGPQSGPLPLAASAARDAEEAALFGWAESVCGGEIVAIVQASGGNRARSWALDIRGSDGAVQEVFLRYGPERPPGVEPYTIHREAQVYRAIADAPVRAPKLIAEHPRLQAILTGRAQGIAEFRRIREPAIRQSIAREAMQELAALHRVPVAGLVLDGGVAGPRIADHVRAELAIWRAMYAESGRRDALCEFALDWLEREMPDPDGPVVLVHGDAGPGNFLFAEGRLTALIDWELAHLGDPMEDLAWFSMRSVMEPVPDFAASLADYEAAAGAAADRARILYHRVFVSTRVVIIRHRNVTGEPAHAIVSRALNRRLLVEALAEAAGIAPDLPALPALAETPRSELFAQVLDDLRDVIVARSTDKAVIGRAKSAAKILKYLDAWDRAGPRFEAEERADLASLFGDPGLGLAEGRERLLEAVSDRSVPMERLLGLFARQSAREAQLAAGASGGIAHRHYPAL